MQERVISSYQEKQEEKQRDLEDSFIRLFLYNEPEGPEDPEREWESFVGIRPSKFALRRMVEEYPGLEIKEKACILLLRENGVTINENNGARNFIRRTRAKIGGVDYYLIVREAISKGVNGEIAQFVINSILEKSTSSSSLSPPLKNALFDIVRYGEPEQKVRASRRLLKGILNVNGLAYIARRVMLVRNEVSDDEIREIHKECAPRAIKHCARFRVEGELSRADQQRGRTKLKVCKELIGCLRALRSTLILDVLNDYKSKIDKQIEVLEGKMDVLEN